MTPRLACFDLDNTLIDRDAAFQQWARWWTERAGLGADAADWLVAQDNSGFTPRAQLFGLARARFGLATPVEELVASYHEEHPRFTWVEQPVLDGLAALREAGWRIAVVTNGETVQQSLKLAHTGLEAAVDFACISESVGVRKPARQIFEAAATGAGAPLENGWMVGDHPSYDIAGGRTAGLHTIQVGRRNGPPTPDHQVDAITAAFPLILEGSSRSLN
ncbi:HAD family hydrolase [Kribbella sp. HUAS MG21]|uniref:HAD family hydrolase n=1 Tax=Kribbella sp. HUAS MG21 TaxID=3160966 RepID=A0AAU7T9N5_9ACTN